MTKLSGIAHKLRALRAIAEEGSGATEAERLAAAAKYQELLEKTHLDASELELREEGTGHKIVAFSGGNGLSIVKGFNGPIGRFTETKTWLSTRAGEFHILGLQSDAEFAEWLVSSLVTHVQAAAMEFILNLEAGFRGDVESFASAAGIRIGTRMDELTRERKAQMSPSARSLGALVPVRAKMIEEDFAKLGIRLFAQRPTQISGREHAMAAGQAAGDRASFARPINGTGTTLRIGNR